MDSWEIMRIIQQLPDKDMNHFYGTYYAKDQDYSLNEYLDKGAVIKDIATVVIGNDIVQVIMLMIPTSAVPNSPRETQG
jgi:hypothetical protein